VVKLQRKISYCDDAHGTGDTKYRSSAYNSRKLYINIFFSLPQMVAQFFESYSYFLCTRGKGKTQVFFRRQTENAFKVAYGATQLN